MWINYEAILVGCLDSFPFYVPIADCTGCGTNDATILRAHETGRMVAGIEANEWQVNPNRTLDGNFDDSAVEVINERWGSDCRQVSMVKVFCVQRSFMRARPESMFTLWKTKYSMVSFSSCL